MALLDFLKKKKDAEKSRKQPEKRVETVSVAPKVSTIDKNFSYSVIREPHISEKGTILSEKNTYVFKIYNNTNKPEIKKAVEGIYGVDVLNVNVVTIPRKKRRLGRREGFKKAYRKAMVTIKEGQKIEIF